MEKGGIWPIPDSSKTSNLQIPLLHFNQNHVKTCVKHVVSLRVFGNRAVMSHLINMDGEVFITLIQGKFRDEDTTYDSLLSDLKVYNIKINQMLLLMYGFRCGAKINFPACVLHLMDVTLCVNH